MSRSSVNTKTLEVPPMDIPRMMWIEVGDQYDHKAYAMKEGARLIVGKKENCDVILRDRTVSSTHCELRCSKGLLWVKDLASKNGVYAGGVRVEQARLSPGACLNIGAVPVCVRTGQAADSEDAPLPGVVGTSSAMLRVASHARRLAKLAVPILIRGATGTGKEVVARAIHAVSPRAHGPFVPLNMGTIPASLAAAELFGHARGAYTGANQPRKGAFLAAHGGTLFLDEIGEANSDVQVHLLRALEQHEVQPLGADQRVAVDVRVIAATWVPLEKAVRERSFRRDLFHRLAVGTIQLPPLIERKTDIGALAEHVLASHRQEIGVKRLAPDALARLTVHDWPGNVRELSNVVLRAAVLVDRRWIRARHVDMALTNSPRPLGRMSAASAQAIVTQCGGKVAVAARRCGVPRSTFRGWLQGAPKQPAT